VDNKATSGVYHCIVGTNFACSVTHETHFSCYLSCDNVGPALSRAALQTAPQPGSSGSSVGSAGWRAALRTRGQSHGRPNLHKALETPVLVHPWAASPAPHRLALGRATHSARPAGMPGGPCAAAAVWPLRRGRSCRSHRATIPLIPTTQVSLLIYKSKDSPFD